MIEIYAPRWRDRVVLIAKYKVTPGANKVRFTKAGSYNGIYNVDSSVIYKSPLDTNGRIDCYAVPFSELERVE